MRMRHLTFLLCLAISSLAIAADSLTIQVMDGLDYTIPANSPVQFASKGNFTEALFQGRFTMTGTYYYSHISEAEDSEDMKWDGTELYFIPDKKYRMKLPYWAQRGRVNEVWFSNPEEFLKTAVSTEMLTKVRNTVGVSVTGRVSILVEDFRASVECDYASYSTRFVALSAPGTIQVAQTAVDHYGC